MTFKSKIVKTAGAVTLAVAAVAGLTGTANAVTGQNGAYYVGYGEPNNTHSVWCVQHSLNYALGTHLAEDGVFGPNTASELEGFQRLYGVQADGVVGPNTGELLFIGGDPYYNNGTSGPGYCYWYLPTTS